MRNIKSISGLLFPNKFIQSIKDHKIEIRGAFTLWFAFSLELLIIIPLSIIVFGKSFLESPTAPLNAFSQALLIITLTVIFVPLAFLFFDGTVIFISLKLFRSPITYSKTLLARTIGLIPLILFIPLKALLYSPSDLVSSFFWPPWTGIFVTLTNEIVIYPPDFTRFIIQGTAIDQLKLVITFLLLLWTFFRTSRVLKNLGELNKKVAYLATILQMIIWDITAIVIAITFSFTF